MSYIRRLFTLPLLMLAIGLVVMLIGIVIMYEPWQEVRGQGSSILAYISFGWCFFWAVINEICMSRKDHEYKNLGGEERC